jgi:hypothetical protein
MLFGFVRSGVSIPLPGSLNRKACCRSHYSDNSFGEFYMDHRGVLGGSKCEKNASAGLAPSVARTLNEAVVTELMIRYHLQHLFLCRPGTIRSMP